MSDIDTTAATQATSFAPSPSSHATLESSPDATSSQNRSPSPVGRNPKRRRLESAFPENHYNTNELNYEANLGLGSPFQNIHLDHAGSIDSQPTFLGHNREFMSYIISTGGVSHMERATARYRHHLPGSHFGARGLPTISADSSSFVGWREKVDTWPLEKTHPMQRSYTFPG